MMMEQQKTAKIRCCMIESCENSKGSSKNPVLFFTPQPIVYDKWKRAIEDYQEVHHLTIVCSLHFKSEDFVIRNNRICLKVEAIPSVFPTDKLVKPQIKNEENIPSLSEEDATVDKSVLMDSESFNDFDKPVLMNSEVSDDFEEGTVRLVDLNAIINGSDDTVDKNDIQNTTQPTMNDMDETPDEMDTPPCNGCTVRDSKIEMLLEEIGSLKKDLEYQKQLVEYLESKSSQSSQKYQSPSTINHEVEIIESDCIQDLDSIDVGSSDQSSTTDHFSINNLRMAPDQLLSTDQLCTQVKEEPIDQMETQCSDSAEDETTPIAVLETLNKPNFPKPIQYKKSTEIFARPGVQRRRLPTHKVVFDKEKVQKPESNRNTLKILLDSMGNRLKLYKCAKCNECFELPAELREHAKTHEDQKPEFECIYCKTAFRTCKSVMAHMKTIHSKYEKCIVCRGKFEEHEIDKHLCGAKDHIDCEYCEQRFTSIKQLVKHIESHGDNIKMHKCLECPGIFSMKILYQYHQRYHQENEQFKCPKCSKTFDSNVKLDTHMKNHSYRGKKNNLCEQCGKGFDSIKHLELHLKIHSGQKPTIKCPDCPKYFRKKNQLDRHSYMHRNLKFVCSICGAELINPYSLTSHMKRMHSDITPIECKICNKKIKHEKMLRAHMQMHANPTRKFKCDYCSQTYKYSGDLYKHLRTHLGDKIYKCDQCDKRFKFQLELKKHSFEHYKEQQTAADKD